MYTDTHCHLSHVADRGEDLSSLLVSLSDAGYPLVIDVGTKPGDLASRVERVRAAWVARRDPAGEETGDLPQFVRFSAGIWPDAGAIARRDESLAALERDIDALLALESARPATRLAARPAARLAALGECGLDRYWNGAGAPGRMGPASEDGPGTDDLAGEEELFGLQLMMARRRGLAVIVHSRDAFDATRSCLKSADWHRGVIHCFAYGIAEARAFLDLGWHISFPGNITWAKRDTDRERVASLIRYVPRDRLLLETDSPYLAPAPHRGKTNTPLLVSRVYEEAASMLGVEPGALAREVRANAERLFSVEGVTEGRG
jgi:TatD DNase family protein